MRMIITKGPDRVVIYLLLIVMGLLFAFPLYSMVAKSLQGFGIQNYISLFTRTGRRRADLARPTSTPSRSASSTHHRRGHLHNGRLRVLQAAVPRPRTVVRCGDPLPRGSGHRPDRAGIPHHQPARPVQQLSRRRAAEAALTIPFGVLLMRNYGRNIDDALIEAAKLDGAGHFRMFWHVFLPLARPVVVNLIVLCFIWSLQDFLWPSMLFTNPDLTSAAQAVASFSNVLGRSPEDFGRYNASLVLLAIPAALFVCSASASSSTASPPAAPKTDRPHPRRTHTMTTITAVDVVDVRFPTSLTAGRLGRDEQGRRLLRRLRRPAHRRPRGRAATASPSRSAAATTSASRRPSSAACL